MMRELFPEEVHFIQIHLGQDMTAGEIAVYFNVSVARVEEAADDLNLINAKRRPIRLYTPYPTRVAVHVRKATQKDAYLIPPSSGIPDCLRRVLPP